MTRIVAKKKMVGKLRRIGRVPVGVQLSSRRHASTELAGLAKFDDCLADTEEERLPLSSCKHPTWLN